VACLRVATDCLIMIECGGTVEAGTLLALLVSWQDLQLYAHGS
jgi:hypothetical protein